MEADPTHGMAKIKVSDINYVKLFNIWFIKYKSWYTYIFKIEFDFNLLKKIKELYLLKH